MRALHLFSNWKWTGPAEIAVNVCLGLRAAGVDARFACGRTPPGEPGRTTVSERAVARGLTPVLHELTLGKHMGLFANWRDARGVRWYARHEKIAVVHAHLPNDHSIARRALGAAPEVRLVRTSYDGEAIKPTLRQRRALALTDALLCASEATRADAIGSLDFPADRTFLVESPIDTARFDAARDAALRERGRALLGLEPGAFAIGIVARMQTHRNFDVFLEAIRRAHQATPSLRAVVIGRGTNQEVVARDPARRMGLGDVIRFPGYLEGEEYVAALAALDAKCFLVPGSDGSCRAVREALSMGKPVIAARRGMLPSIVKDGETGFIVDDRSADALVQAIGRLESDAGLRSRMGAAARRDALERFSIDRAARQVREAYDATLARPRRAARDAKGAAAG